MRLEWLGKRKKSFFDGLAIVVLIYFQIAYLFLSLAAFQPRIALNTVQMIRVVLSRDAKNSADGVPTILGMHGIGIHAYYGTSFLDDLQANTQKTNNRCIVSVQPFSGGAISIINYPIKHVFNLRRGLVSVYDLEGDPNEIKKIKESRWTKQLLECLMLV